MRTRAGLLVSIALGGLVMLAATPAHAFPAFARRTGLRCTGCHEQWPVFNDTGRAFRDNGYQMRLGKDHPTENPFSYWPVAVRITPNYQFVSAHGQETDQGKKTIDTGGIADGAMDLLIGGNLNDNVSYLVVPTGFASDGAVSLESFWVYFTRVFGSDWFNVRLGKHEVDLTVSAHRSVNLTSPFLIYSYHPAVDADAAGAFGLDTNQRGIEVLGHDEGSLTRYSVSLFNANDSLGSKGAWDSPGYYAHFQKFWQLDSAAVSEVEVGGFTSAARYPTSALTLDGEPIAGSGKDLKETQRYGLEASALFGREESPLHLTAAWAHGTDDKGLYGEGARDGTWSGGFLEAIWVPPTEGLHWGVFGRYDFIRNSQQPLADTPKSLDDQNQWTIGFKYTMAFFNRDEYALHVEYSTNTEKKAAFDGSDLKVDTAFVGVDFAF